jgi:hypothetical protein
VRNAYWIREDPTQIWAEIASNELVCLVLPSESEAGREECGVVDLLEPGLDQRWIGPIWEHRWAVNRTAYWAFCRVIRKTGLVGTVLFFLCGGEHKGLVCSPVPVPLLSPPTSPAHSQGLLAPRGSLASSPRPSPSGGVSSCPPRHYLHFTPTKAASIGILR